MIGTAPAEIEMFHDYAGRVEQITRQVGDEVKNVAPDETTTFDFAFPGRYRVDMQCYNDLGERVGISQFFVEIVTDDQQDARGSHLTASTLSTVVGETVSFSTEIA
jgi:hypothetical protein